MLLILFSFFQPAYFPKITPGLAGSPEGPSKKNVRRLLVRDFYRPNALPVTKTLHLRLTRPGVLKLPDGITGKVADAAELFIFALTHATELAGDFVTHVCTCSNYALSQVDRFNGTNTMCGKNGRHDMRYVTVTYRPM